MSDKRLQIPGTPKDEFIEEFGEEALSRVPHTHILSWDHQVYILDGWASAEDER